MVGGAGGSPVPVGAGEGVGCPVLSIDRIGGADGNPGVPPCNESDASGDGTGGKDVSNGGGTGRPRIALSNAGAGIGAGVDSISTGGMAVVSDGAAGVASGRGAGGAMGSDASAMSAGRSVRGAAASVPASPVGTGEGADRSSVAASGVRRNDASVD